MLPAALRAPKSRSKTSSHLEPVFVEVRWGFNGILFSTSTPKVNPHEHGHQHQKSAEQ